MIKQDWIMYTVLLVVVFAAFYYIALKPVIKNIDEIATLAAKANQII
jgi:hypothetical protein